jgi:acetoin:2,6-dichlorophenolindophenol oxidoreductase subunit alpha
MTQQTERLFREMFLIRTVEEKLLDLFSKGKLRGTVHTCIGQEACAVGVINALDKENDIICSNHRGHGHFISYCNNYQKLILEIMGNETGICNGIGGSQHLHLKNFYSNGILGGMVPVTVGMALAEKQKKSKSIGVVFFGDGAMAEGIVYESFNIASLWKIPVLFVVEHNQYAQSTPTKKEHSGDISTRSTTFGIKVTIQDGNHLDNVLEIAKKIVNEIRINNEPQLLFLETYRLASHSKGDDLRDVKEIESNKLRDPITMFKNSHPSLNYAEIEDEIIREVNEFVDNIK